MPFSKPLKIWWKPPDFWIPSDPVSTVYARGLLKSFFSPYHQGVPACVDLRKSRENVRDFAKRPFRETSGCLLYIVNQTPLLMARSYSTTAGNLISKAVATQGITDYKNNAAFAALQQKKAHFFGSSRINQVLNQAGCIGLRMWYGWGPDEDGNQAPQLYVVAVDANGNDILPAGNEIILDDSMPCPRYCPTGSSLEV